MFATPLFHENWSVYSIFCMMAWIIPFFSNGTFLASISAYLWFNTLCLFFHCWNFITSLFIVDFVPNTQVYEKVRLLCWLSQFSFTPLNVLVLNWILEWTGCWSCQDVQNIAWELRVPKSMLLMPMFFFKGFSYDIMRWFSFGNIPWCLYSFNLFQKYLIQLWIMQYLSTHIEVN